MVVALRASTEKCAWICFGCFPRTLGKGHVRVERKISVHNRRGGARSRQSTPPAAVSKLPPLPNPLLQRRRGSVPSAAVLVRTRCARGCVSWKFVLYFWVDAITVYARWHSNFAG